MSSSGKYLGTYDRELSKQLATGNISDHKRHNAHDLNVPIGSQTILQQFIVLDVVPDPSAFLVSKQNPNNQEIGKKLLQEKIEYWKSLDVAGVEKFASVLPRNTIIGKRIYDAQSTSVESAQFLFPLLSSHLALPCKPGEHVWVIFERLSEQERGYWISKVQGIFHVDDVNHTHAPRALETSFAQTTKNKADGKRPSYTYAPGRIVESEDGSFTALADTSFSSSDDPGIYEKIILNSDGSQLVGYESVPRFKKRPADIAIEGSNNTLIVLGTDRYGPIADFNEKIPKKIEGEFIESAGEIDIVVGRGQTPATGGEQVTSKKLTGQDFKNELDKSYDKINPNEGDPDFVNDKSRILVSQRTKIDKKAKIENINQNLSLKDSEEGDAAIFLKSDKIRVHGRKDIQILVKDDQGNDVSTVVASSTGEVKIVSKSTSISIDQSGNISIDSNGDVIINPAGQAKIGSSGASKGCARQNDNINITPGFEAWLKTELFKKMDKPTPPGAPPIPPPASIDFPIGSVATFSNKVLISD